MGFEYEDGGWPIVEARWTGTVTDLELSEALARIDSYLGRGQRFGLLIDARGGGAMSPEQRNRVLSHMKARAALTSELLVQAAVIDNLVHRTLFYGVALLFPSPFPSKVFADVAAARTWLAKMLSQPERPRG